MRPLFVYVIFFFTSCRLDSVASSHHGTLRILRVSGKVDSGERPNLLHVDLLIYIQYQFWLIKKFGKICI